jgi:hypothetical protein
LYLSLHRKAACINSSVRTYNSKIDNRIMLPDVNFVYLLLRMETINLKRVHGIVKATGVLLCFAGVVVLAFYSGPELRPINHHHLSLYHASSSHDNGASTQSRIKWALGIFSMSSATICLSFWQVMQVPHPFSKTFLPFLFFNFLFYIIN